MQTCNVKFLIQTTLQKNNQHNKKKVAHGLNAFESTPPLFAFNLSSFRPEPFVFEEKKRKNQILIKNVIAKRHKMKTKQWTHRHVQLLFRKGYSASEKALHAY